MHRQHSQTSSHAYEQILDRNLRKQFPDWDSISQWDPTKLLAEGFRASLVEIESRQSSVVSTLIDSLPSLLGVSPLPAQPPVYLVQLQPTPALKQAVRIPRGSQMKLQLDGMPHEMCFEKGVTVLPVHKFKSEKHGSSVRFEFFSKQTPETLSFYFLPEVGALASNLLRVEGGRVLQDTTERFTCRGTVEISLHPVQPERPDGQREFTLHFGVAPAGEWYVNAAEGVLRRTVFNVPLGQLKGDPWESIALPPEMLGPPATLVVRLPNEQTRTLSAAQECVLLQAHSEPATIADSFVYNALRHELILPGASESTQGFLGGVQVSVPEADWVTFSGDQFTAVQVAHRFPRAIESVMAGVRVRDAVGGETPIEYLRRFYGMLRAFQSSVACAKPDELCRQIPAYFPQVRKAEAERVGSEWVFYIRLHGDTGALEGASVAHTLDSVTAWIGERMVLGERFRVRPFRHIPVRCLVRGVSGGLAQVHEQIHCAMDLALEEAGAQWSVSDCARLLGSLQETSVVVRFLVGEWGACAQRVVRHCGEAFCLSVELESESEVPGV